MTGIHEIDVRMKYVIQVVYQLLVLLLEYSTKQHIDCTTTADQNIGLAEIFAKHENYIKNNLKVLLKDYYKNYFYDPTTKLLITAVKINKLDLLVICIILRSPKLSSIMANHCCGKCAHKCNKCVNIGVICERSVDCVYTSCTCGCDYENLLHFFNVAKALRNTNAHTPYQRYLDFENGKVLDDFPLCNTWQDIWKTVNNACLNCLNFLLKVNKIDMEDFKDHEMDLRIALKKDHNFLLPVVGSFIKQYQMIILGEEDFSQKVSKIQQNILDNNKLLSMEYAYLENKLVCFEDASEKNLLKIKSIKSKSIVCEYNNFHGEISDIVLQIKASGSSWYLYPQRLYDWMINGNCFVVDILELDCDVTYSLRLLGIKEDGTIFSFAINDLNLKSFESSQYVASQSLMIDEEIQIDLYQKTERGVVILLPGSVTKLFTVQTNASSKWEDLKPHHYSWNEENSQLKLRDLECKSQNIRCIVNFADELKITSFILSNIDIVGRRHLYHVTNNGSIVAIMHGYGACDDLHQNISKLHHLRLAQHLTTEYRTGGGAITHSITDADDYLSINFPNQKSIIFPPFSVEYSGKDVKKTVECLEKIFKTSCVSKQRIVFVLNESNLTQLLERSCKEELSFDLSKLCNTIVVFDGSLSMVLFITYTEATNNHELYQDHAFLHNFMKFFINISGDLLIKNYHQKQPVGLVGILSTFTLSRQQLDLLNFCHDKSPCCCDIFLTSCELENQGCFEAWYKKVSRKVVKEFQTRGISSFDKPTIHFSSLANRLMVLLALCDVNLPSAFGSNDKKIRSLLLNEEQMRAVNSPSKWKLILGPYGSGKTIVGQRTLEKLVRNINPNTNIIYYIICDEYSLLQNEIKKLCQDLQEASGVVIKCCNIRDLDLSGTLNGCLSTISRRDPSNAVQYTETGKNKDTKQTVHLFFDELDVEQLTEAESRLVCWQLERYFKESFVLFVTQSIHKKRSYLLDLEIDVKSNCLEILADSIEILSLHSVMRYSSNILDASQIVQDSLEATANMYIQPSFIERGNTKSIPKKKIVKGKKEGDLQKIATPTRDLVGEDVGGFDVPDGAVPSPPQPLKRRMGLDRLMKITSSLSYDSSSMAIKTAFRFFVNQGCGHGIRGEKPSLVRFQQDDFSVPTIAKVIDEYLDPKWKKIMFICNEITIASAVSKALSALGITVIDYLDGLQNKVPTDERKQIVYTRWLEELECVLLTDNRGCRGLQHEQVVVLLDENDYYEGFLLPEMFGRATSNLTLLSFNMKSFSSLPRPNVTKTNSTIGCFIEELVKKDLVNLLTLESIPNLKNLQFNLGSSQDFKVHLSKSQWVEEWLDVIRSQTRNNREISNLNIFMVMKKLAQYIVYRRIGKETAKPDSPEESLFKVCDNIVSSNETVFQNVTDVILSDGNNVMPYFNSFTTIISNLELNKMRNSGRIVSVFALCMVICGRLFERYHEIIYLDSVVEQTAEELAKYDWMPTSSFWDSYVRNAPASKEFTMTLVPSVLALLAGISVALQWR